MRTFPPLRREDGSWARGDSEKASTFADHLQKVFTPHPYSGPEEHKDCITRNLNIPAPLLEQIKNFTKSEIVKAINNLNLKKAPGYDLITGRILKELPDEGVIYLLQIFNAMLRLNFVSPQWKTAQVIIILKPDQTHEDTRSYRSISLLPIPFKLFETLLLTRILPVVEKMNLIPTHQFGFRHKHGNIDQVHRIFNKVHRAMENKEYCSVFTDVSQAFDRVWHEGLLFKMKTNLPKFFLVLKSYIINRHYLQGKYHNCQKPI